MDDLAAHRRPRLSAEEAARVLARLWGRSGRLSSLPSERDQNFRVELDDGELAVLKLANPGDPPHFLELQNRVQARAREALSDWSLPRALPTRDGATVGSVEADGGPVPVRLVTWVPGVPLAEASPRSPDLARSVGRMLGRLDRALASVHEPGARRQIRWDPRRAHRVLTDHADAVTDPRRRALLDRMAGRAADGLAPLEDGLRLGLIHNDANDHNVIVTDVRGDPDGAASRRASGLIDFGDLVHSWVAAEAAVACAYAMMDQADPLGAAVALVGGYVAEHPLEPAELTALPHLIARRLLVSVTLSAVQAAQEPDRSYLSVSESAAWRLLEVLDRTPPALLECRFRHQAGLEPHPRAAALRAWLRDVDVAPVLEPDPARVPTVVLDLSVGSLEQGSDVADLDADGFTRLVFHRMEGAGARVGLGRYDEARRWYGGEAYAVEGEGPERRTVHLGVDLFAPAGTPVRAPLAGTVEWVADNDAPLDYGPTLVLAHAGPDGAPFHTLYGHLDRDALDRWRPGQPVEAGQEIATLGEAGVNGGWPPHLHFQVLTDLLGQSGNYPGVAPPSQRAVWLSLCPDPNLLLHIEGLEPAGGGLEPDLILERRSRHLGPTLSVSYREPLKIVRGQGAHLLDHEGRAYLDCVNNVAHVGHSHPRVVAAAARQMGVLNTNTRYLHENLVRYAERLADTLPGPLSVCFLVCSGSEANELALRMARAWSGARDVVVVDGAYHGNTSSLVDLSPYKFDGPGGGGRPDHVHVVPMPDPYRGAFRADGPDPGGAYAGAVAETVADLDRRGRRPAAFFCESILSCGGQIVLPGGYLEGAAEAVQGAGGLYVADEVQVGFGRVGRHFWAFQEHGVVPDIVTMGKPMGNGHPLGAVVTTPEVAAAFDTGMEYFNTFGGNPVSCAVGLAVLDVIRDEGLQEAAARVGGVLLRGLEGLKERHPVVGDVRGRGLFIGVELVLDPEARTPAPAHARHLVERMKDRGVLLSTDGPDHNVIKIKPPLVFSEADAAGVVEGMDRVLAEDAFQI